MKNLLKTIILGLILITLGACKKHKEETEIPKDKEFIIVGHSSPKNQADFSVSWTSSGKTIFKPEDGSFNGAHLLNPSTVGGKPTIAYYGLYQGKVIYFIDGQKKLLSTLTGRISSPAEIGETITGHIRDDNGNTYIFCDQVLVPGTIAIGVSAYYYKISPTGVFTVHGGNNGIPIITETGVQFLRAITVSGSPLSCYLAKEDNTLETLYYTLTGVANRSLVNYRSTKEKAVFIMAKIDLSGEILGDYAIVTLDLKTKTFKQQELTVSDVKNRYDKLLLYNNVLYLAGYNPNANKPFYATVDLSNQSSTLTLVTNNLPVTPNSTFLAIPSDIAIVGDKIYILGTQGFACYWLNGQLKELDNTGLESSTIRSFLTY